jgi:type VI secretion system protein ImpJ
MSSGWRDEPSAFSVPDPVQWHEGMLLTPQHFQLEARRIEALVSAQARAAAPYLWGVARLEIDRSALLAGLFRITAVEALMGDGLTLSIPAAGDPPLELDLKALDRDLAAAPAAIHVAVAERSDRSAAPGALRRYRSVEGPMAHDENTGADPTAAPRLRAVPMLAATDDVEIGPGGAFVSLPVARVAERDGRIVLLEHQPPLLRVTRGQPIHDVAAEVSLRLRERMAALAERLRTAREAGAPEAVAIAAALGALAGPSPRLEALVRDESASPYALYLSLCDALGAAAAVDPALAPPTPPAYRHADALPAFRALSAMILPALDKLRAGRRLAPFERLADGGFACPAPPGGFPDPIHVLIRPGPGERADAARTWAQAAIVASEDRMARARALRVRGAPRKDIGGPAELDVAAPPNAVAVDHLLANGKSYLKGS